MKRLYMQKADITCVITHARDPETDTHGVSWINPALIERETVNYGRKSIVYKASQPVAVLIKRNGDSLDYSSDAHGVRSMMASKASKPAKFSGHLSSVQFEQLQTVGYVIL